MQEEVEQKTLTLSISAARLTSRVLKSAISKYLAYRKSNSGKLPKAVEGKADKAQGRADTAAVKPCGKQTVAQLVGQNQGVTNIEISDKNIKDFDKVARKYGIDYDTLFAAQQNAQKLYRSQTQSRRKAKEQER